MNWALTFECKGRWLGLIDTWPSSKIWVLFQFVEDKLVDYCRLGLFKTLDQRTAALVGWARRYIVGWLGWFPFSVDVDKCVCVCVWVSSSRCRHMKYLDVWCRHRLFHLPILTKYWILGIKEPGMYYALLLDWKRNSSTLFKITRYLKTMRDGKFSFFVAVIIYDQPMPMLDEL